MDRTYIQSQHIVERYLSGDLTVREAREFERYCMENPDVLNSLPIPVRVKTKLARKPGDEIDSSDFDPTTTITSVDAAGLDADDEASSAGYRGAASSRGGVVALGIMLVVALVGAGVLYFQKSTLEKQMASAHQTAQATQLRAPGSMQEYRVNPSQTRPAAPTVNIGSPNPPKLIELHVNMSEGKYNMFLVTIDNVTEGRAMQIRRVARDTNGELLIGLNSSAFPAGDYDLKLEGYTWRGDTVPMGWVRLGMK